MTISVVQSASSPDLSGDCTLGTGLTENNWLVIIGAGYYNSGVPADPAVGGDAITATTLLTGYSALGDPGVDYAIWLAAVTGAMAGQTAVSCTANLGGGAAIKTYAIELHSAGALSLDQAASNESASGSSTASAGPTAGSAASGELAVCACPAYGVNPDVTSGGWTVIGDQNYMSAGYQLLGDAGSTASLSAPLSGSAPWAAGIVTIQEAGGGGWPDLTFSGPSTSGGVDTWTVATTINGTAGQTVRALVPTSPDESYAHGILITLPAADGEDDTSSGDGFDTVQALGAHNAYNLTVIESSYTTPGGNGPCYADQTTDPNTLQETYTLELIRWALATYGTTGHELVYLIGYSKSGFGAMTLIFRNPSVIHKAAGWDSPFDLDNITTGDGVAAGAGAYAAYEATFAGGFGTQAIFAANYEIPANLSTWAAADPTFGTVRRLWVGGYAYFQTADEWMGGTALPGAGVLADASWSSGETHAWHPDWVSAALASMLGTPSGPGLTWAAII